MTRRDIPTGRRDKLGREIKVSSTTAAHQAQTGGLDAALAAEGMKVAETDHGWVEMPAAYDPARVTMEDMQHDHSLRLVDDGEAAASGTIGVKPPRMARGDRVDIDGETITVAEVRYTSVHGPHEGRIQVIDDQGVERFVDKDTELVVQATPKPTDFDEWVAELDRFGVELHPTRAAADEIEFYEPTWPGGDNRHGDAIVRVDVDGKPLGWVIGWENEHHDGQLGYALERHGVPFTVETELEHAGY